jgi:hypothetical protein
LSFMKPPWPSQAALRTPFPFPSPLHVFMCLQHCIPSPCSHWVVCLTPTLTGCIQREHLTCSLMHQCLLCFAHGGFSINVC